MSTIKHPVGPQPNKVYWRRRLIVLLVLLAVIVVVVLIVIRPGASNGATPAPAATKSSTAHPKASSPSSTTIPTTAKQVAGAPCKAQFVTVDALTDAATYAAGQEAQLTLSLMNTGTKTCTLDAGTATQAFTITSGSEVYWKSSDCQTDPVHTEILLKPGKAVVSSPITWDRTRSDPSTCSGTRDAVPAGGASYHLKVSVGGFDAKTTKQFQLN